METYYPRISGNFHGAVYSKDRASTKTRNLNTYSPASSASTQVAKSTITKSTQEKTSTPIDFDHFPSKAKILYKTNAWQIQLCIVDCFLSISKHVPHERTIA